MTYPDRQKDGSSAYPKDGSVKADRGSFGADIDTRVKLKPIYIVGPTASGKSELAYLAAKRFDGVIISADSMQIYKGLDVGTAKEQLSRRAEVAHEMIDIVPPDAEFSVAEYAVTAKKHIENALKGGKLPIVCGGTGLYIEALISPMSFANTSRNEELRAALLNELKTFGAQYMRDKLENFDPGSASRLHVNDTKRVIRALEIVLSTGKTLSENADARKIDEDVIMIGLDTQRSALYDRINARVDEMIKNGLVKEVFSIGNFSYQSMQAIGYKEFAGCEYGVVDGEVVISEEKLAEITNKIKQNTRNYAKRQLTWFRKYKDKVKWFECGDYENALNYVESKLKA